MSAKRHPRYQRVIAAGIWAVALVSALYTVLQPRAAPANASGSGVTVGSRAPDFTLPGTDGQPISLGAFKGRPVVVTFFATWCSTCRAEMPDLEAAYQSGKDQGLVILAVNAGEAAVSVDAFRQRLNLTFPVALDAGSRVTRLYDVIPLPTAYFIDPGGLVRARHIGLAKPEQLRDLIARIVPGGDIRG